MVVVLFPINYVNISCSPRCSIICVRSGVSSMEKLERWNICRHVTITMTHYLLTAATSNGQNAKLHSQSLLNFFIFGQRHLVPVKPVPGPDMVCTRPRISFTTVAYMSSSFFYGPRQHLGGGICYVVASYACHAAKYVGNPWMSFRPKQLRLSDAG